MTEIDEAVQLLTDALVFIDVGDTHRAEIYIESAISALENYAKEQTSGNRNS